MPQTLNALRIAARGLYLRQLLSEAAKAELATQIPAVSGLLGMSCMQLALRFPCASSWFMHCTAQAINCSVEV